MPVIVTNSGTPLGPLTGVTTIAAGALHACATLASGDIGNSILCWGLNSSGQFGDGTTSANPMNTVSQTARLQQRSVVAITANDERTCSLLTSGGVTCWGSDAGGFLANGITEAHAPVLVQF